MTILGLLQTGTTAAQWFVFTLERILTILEAVSTKMDGLVTLAGTLSADLKAHLAIESAAQAELSMLKAEVAALPVETTALEAKIDAISASLTADDASVAPVSVPTAVPADGAPIGTPAALPVPVVAPTVPAQPITPTTPEPVTLNVGPSEQFRTIQAAMESVAGPSWQMDFGTPLGPPIIVTLNLTPDDYTDQFSSNYGGSPPPVAGVPYVQTLLAPIVVQAMPGTSGLAVLNLTTLAALYYGKGIFNTRDKDATFRRVHFKMTAPGYVGLNVSAVRIDDGGFTTTNKIRFENCEIEGFPDGILGGTPGQTVEIDSCYLHGCGVGDGLTHNAYINHVDLLTVTNTLSVGAITGHLLKSRAAKTVIQNTRLFDGPDGSASYCLHVPNGGTLDVDGLIMHKGQHASNAPFIVVDDETTGQLNGAPNSNPSIKLRNVTMISEIPNGQRFGLAIGLWNARSAPMDIPDGTVSTWNVDPARMLMTGLYGSNVCVPWLGGRVTQLAAMPVLDFTSPVLAG